MVSEPVNRILRHMAVRDLWPNQRRQGLSADLSQDFVSRALSDGYQALTNAPTVAYDMTMDWISTDFSV